MIGHQKYTNELTPREQEVLDCLMDGLDYKETAKKLCVVLTTLYTHRNNIFQKRGVNTLQQLLVKEYKALFARSDLFVEFKRIQKQIYQEMAEEIQKKIKEVENV